MTELELPVIPAEASRLDQLRAVVELRRALADRDVLERFVRSALDEAGSAPVAQVFGLRPAVIEVAFAS